MTAPHEPSEVVRAPRAVTRTRERAARLARVVSGTAIATVFALVAATVARAEVEPPKDEGDPATIFRAAVDALAAERPADPAEQTPAERVFTLAARERIGISNGLVCEKPGKPDSALGGQPMPAWMAWNWRLGRCLVWIRPALTARLALVGP